jgi:hypothetical protein
MPKVCRHGVAAYFSEAEEFEEQPFARQLTGEVLSRELELGGKENEVLLAPPAGR